MPTADRIMSRHQAETSVLLEVGFGVSQQTKSSVANFWRSLGEGPMRHMHQEAPDRYCLFRGFFLCARRDSNP